MNKTFCIFDNRQAVKMNVDILKHSTTAKGDQRLGAWWIPLIGSEVYVDFLDSAEKVWYVQLSCFSISTMVIDVNIIVIVFSRTGAMTVLH